MPCYLALGSCEHDENWTSPPMLPVPPALALGHVTCGRAESAGALRSAAWLDRGRQMLECQRYAVGWLNGNVREWNLARG